jgi:transposase InsO family protein
MSSLYFKPKPKKDEPELEAQVEKVFNDNYKCFGRRRMKAKLSTPKHNVRLSEWKISKIMKKKGLESSYVKGRKKKPVSASTEHKTEAPNMLNRQFDSWKTRNVVLSDLLFYKLNNWVYFCGLLSLNRRNIIGFSVGTKKTAALVKEAFYSYDGDLRDIEILHTDHGSEFTNESIDALLKAFGIKRSLSGKGQPIDNSPMEAFNKSLRTEFLNHNKFISLQQFVVELAKWIKWYNTERPHSSLGYETPILNQKNRS